MADFNSTAKLQYESFTEEEREKAVSMLKTLEGLEIETAQRMLRFCSESLKTKAVVSIY